MLERRTRLALFGTARAREIAPRVAAIVATELDWSAVRRESEIAAFGRQCDARLAWRDLAPHASAPAAAGTTA